MRGVSAICNKLKEITVENDVDLISVEKGYSFKLKDSPYTFKVLCLDDNGWNIYLEPLNDEILVITHRETNLIYSQVERIVEEINYEYYDNDRAVYDLLKECFGKLDEVANEFLDKIDSIVRKNLNYIITFKRRNGSVPTINIRYSIAENSFIYSTDGFFCGDYIYSDLLKVNSIYSNTTQLLNQENGASICFF